MELEHSESLDDQTLCCDLIEGLDEDPGWHDYALQHRRIIARFGRFPHRNDALGRTSSPAEHVFLAQPGSDFVEPD